MSGLLRSELSFLASCVCVRHRVVFSRRTIFTLAMATVRPNHDDPLDVRLYTPTKAAGGGKLAGARGLAPTKDLVVEGV